MPPTHNQGPYDTSLSVTRHKKPFKVRLSRRLNASAARSSPHPSSCTPPTNLGLVGARTHPRTARYASSQCRDAVSRSVPFAGAFIFHEHDACGATSTLAGARPAEPAAHQATAQRQARGPEEPASPVTRLVSDEPAAVVWLFSEKQWAGRRCGKPSRWAPS